MLGSDPESCTFTPMKTSVRWVGLYLLHLLIATLGVGLATAILLEAILKPLLGRGIISIATGPYYHGGGSDVGYEQIQAIPGIPAVLQGKSVLLFPT